MTLRLGIDVGGTHTDAALMDGTTVVHSVKSRTTPDIAGGIEAALHAVLEGGGRPPDQIGAVMIGTTQFTNAVVERRELTESAIVRIALPSGRMVPPKVDWPDDLAAATGDHVYMVHGGRRFDGRELAPLDNAEIDKVIEDIARKELDAVAVASVFSPVDAEPERLFAERLTKRLPDIQVVQSHEIGRMGLLERENAALLNAALLAFANRVVTSFEAALENHGLNCPLYVSQNDGTLMATDFARRFPALTFASGPTNSIRGASLLTAQQDAIVVDIGGTTSDVGVLRGGFPRESNLGIEIGGARTNFRMPDILAIGLGGGSHVSADGVEVGPRSVGYRLVDEGLVFGGDTLTATDIAVAAGYLDLGDKSRVKRLSATAVEAAVVCIHHTIDAAIDRMRSSRDPVPVVLVGGGAVLIDRELATASVLHRPDHADVANAIGAARAEVGAELEHVCAVRDRQASLEALTAAARDKAVQAGADPDDLRVADVEETQISYMAEDTVRIRVKVVGALLLVTQEPSP